MGGTYERSGKTILPQWWTDRVFPILEDKSLKYGELAKRASEVAGRESPWGGDAITKFKQGSAVTRELANAISVVLNVPLPFFEARTEAEAKAFMAISAMEQYAPAAPPVFNPESTGKRATIRQHLDLAVKAKTDQTSPVESADEGRSRSRRSGRSAGRG